jgi:hypothetical protein
LLTRSVGVDFSTGRIRFMDRLNATLGPSKKSLTGHSRPILKGPEKSIECGHTYASGKGIPDYFQGKV